MRFDHAIFKILAVKDSDLTNKQAMEHLSHDDRDSTAGNWLAASQSVGCRPGPTDQRDGNVQNSGLPEPGLTSDDMSDYPIQLGDCDSLIDRGQQIKGKGQ